jgi:putative peptidoglycan lipid II flippase
MKGFLTFFSLRTHTVKQASTLLAATALLSNALGLARNLIFYRFVRLERLDIYFASFRVADLLLNVLIVGAITSAVIPVITELISKKEEAKAHEVINQLLTFATLFFVIIMAVLWLEMRPLLVTFVVHGFDPERLDVAVQLSRLMLIQTVFFAWSFILGALLNGYRRFATYALAPLIYNATLIVGGVWAGSAGIIAITYSVIIGSFLHFFIQFAEARRAGFRLRPTLFRSTHFNAILRLMVPRSVSQAMYQVTLTVYTNLASTLQRGSIAIFSGINDLQTTPTVIVANSLATAYFPALSGYIAEEKWTEMNALLNKVLRLTLFLLVPVIGLSLILRAQIIRLYIGIGHANWQNTDIAIMIFVWFMLGIIQGSVVIILSRIFYAHKDTRTPMVVGIVSSILGIVVSYAGIQLGHHSVAVLAIAETTIATTQCVLYLAILSKRGHVQLALPDLLQSSIRYFVGTLLLCTGAWMVLHLIDLFYTTTREGSTHTVLGLFIQTLLAALVGIAVYFRYSTISSKEEWQWIKMKLFSKIR